MPRIEASIETFLSELFEMTTLRAGTFEDGRTPSSSAHGIVASGERECETVRTEHFLRRRENQRLKKHEKTMDGD